MEYLNISSTELQSEESRKCVIVSLGAKDIKVCFFNILAELTYDDMSEHFLAQSICSEKRKHVR